MPMVRQRNGTRSKSTRCIMLVVRSGIPLWPFMAYLVSPCTVNSLAWAPHELGAILACASSDGKVSVLSFNSKLSLPLSHSICSFRITASDLFNTCTRVFFIFERHSLTLIPRRRSLGRFSFRRPSSRRKLHLLGTSNAPVLSSPLSNSTFNHSTARKEVCYGRM